MDSRRFESQAERHRLPDSWSPAPASCGDEERHVFLLRLDNIAVDGNAMFELQRHGFVKTRQWLPQEPFHKHFSLGAQVNRYESTMAYAYTQGSAFAYAANEMCRNSEWNALFQNYGRCVKCLWSYAEKMQARYGTSQTLYRGMAGMWEDVAAMYQVGSTCIWKAFTSTTDDVKVAVDFAKGKYGGHGRAGEKPIIFVIRTDSRGAPVLRWSTYPNEGEVLLLPFQRFLIEDVQVENGVLVISMHTVTPIQPTFMYQVVAQPGLGYCYSRDLADRDDRPSGPNFRAVVEGHEEGGDWIIVRVPGIGDRFLPIFIAGARKLQPLEDVVPQVVFAVPQFETHEVIRRDPDCCIM